MPVLDVLVELFTIKLPSVCVPMFYFFAGYLFFAKVQTFGLSDYWSRIKKRAQTLLIPYLFWNAAVIVFFWAMHRFASAYINPDFENVTTFSFAKLLNCFWGGSGGQPIAFQFWFIRDLMVVMVASPLTYLIVRRSYLGIIVLTFLYFFFNLPYFTAFYFFSAGAFYALQKINFADFSRRIMVPTLCIAICLLAVRMIFGELPYCRQLYIIFASFSVIGLVDKYFLNRPMAKILSDSSFFIFCYHAIPLLMLEKIMSGILVGRAEVFWIADYFVNPTLIISIGLISYMLLKKFLPSFTSFITGGR